MAQTVDDALKAAQLYTDDLEYQMIKLPARGVVAAASILAEINEPFGAMVVDKDEVTLVIPSDAVTDFARRMYGHAQSPAVYRLITLDVELDPTLTGFMARVSGALAAQGVTVMPFAAFTRDHLLVPAEQFDTAWAALQKLIGRVS